MWRLLCDQNIRTDTVEFLRQKGFDVVSTRDMNLSKATDEEIMEVAQRQERIIVTFNGDFGDIRRFPPDTHCGIIRLRIYPQDRQSVNTCLEKIFSVLTPEMMKGHLATVDQNNIHLRGKDI